MKGASAKLRHDKGGYLILVLRVQRTQTLTGTCTYWEEGAFVYKANTSTVEHKLNIKKQTGKAQMCVHALGPVKDF